MPTRNFSIRIKPRQETGGQALPHQGIPARRPLTPSQRGVLAAYAAGKQAKEIAADRGVSPRTVQSQMLKARARLKARTISHAIYIAVKAGMIE